MPPAVLLVTEVLYSWTPLEPDRTNETEMTRGETGEDRRSNRSLHGAVFWDAFLVFGSCV